MFAMLQMCLTLIGFILVGSIDSQPVEKDLTDDWVEDDEGNFVKPENKKGK